MEQSALIEACTGPWLYIEVLSYDEDHGSNSVWMLDDFTADNGCTPMVPGSSGPPRPAEVLDDPKAPHPRTRN